MEYKYYGDEAEKNPTCEQLSMNELIESTGRNLTDANSVLASILEIISGTSPNVEDKKTFNSMMDLAQGIQFKSIECIHLVSEIRTRLFR